MSLSSMTGFGRADGHSGNYSWVIELKSVNGRGLDIRMNLPSPADQLDQPARALLKSKLNRGNVQVSLTLSSDDTSSGVSINHRELNRLARTARNWSRNGAVQKGHFDGLVSLRGVISSDQSSRMTQLPDAVLDGLQVAVEQALDALIASRLREGEGLKSMLSSILDQMTDVTADAESLAEATPDAIQAKLKERVQTLLKDGEIDEERLAQEIALLASKADVREELDRLNAHITEARQMIGSGGVVGRKLDFLAQELHREANTLGSKASSLELSRCSLALKALVDQFKEQAANVE